MHRESIGWRARGDAVLFERWHCYGDVDAIPTLLSRHGPKVLSLCRCVLRDPHAEEGFQETFLLPARKAEELARSLVVSNPFPARSDSLYQRVKGGRLRGAHLPPLEDKTNSTFRKPPTLVAFDLEA